MVLTQKIVKGETQETHNLGERYVVFYKRTVTNTSGGNGFFGLVDENVDVGMRENFCSLCYQYLFEIDLSTVNGKRGVINPIGRNMPLPEEVREKMSELPEYVGAILGEYDQLRPAVV
ncbi:MAG: hypothetical protein KJ718_04600 [Nanoarchaeota archaeon]|nr:hypothetical protein [Nanoarchaeota archaeon]MBU1051806.1 hypothetical protein [Nanoarchaeota archaeon]MBU1988561.1 hypothetical protein [Nanoarchaeota archaeon]